MRYVERNQSDWSRIQDAEVEVSLVKPDYILLGKVDLIRGEGDTVEIVDFKSEKKPDVLIETAEMNRYRRQLEVYAHLIEEKTGKKVSKMHLYYTGEDNGVPTPSQLRELVLRGSGESYDSLKSRYDFNNMSFTKLKSVYKQRTGNTFEDTDYESFGLIDEKGNLTNAGALLADESPVRHSRLFCTRWNGLTKASGIVDALDDKEYTGSLVTLLQAGTDFVRNNSKKAWRKVGDGRIEMPDYPDRAVLEGVVNALIHRNYLEIGSEVHIDMFDDRIEIYSPGGMVSGISLEGKNLLKIPSK